ncbi:conserved hypothetical protein [Frankia canadensis]|uniref:Uncharacterized protein n=1 Tax=Frankia canadensis TaxID=1836972 RepID=A0A2I2KIP9_9ACTN|nr:hypothetical protein [Frankia canadensis]SNQ45540.1 conserved hypothetical protein [Frankia canadensis]SOU52830.1 conserved hypothetical protein [Frankia canadensis]
MPELAPPRPWLVLSHLRLAASDRTECEGRATIRLRGEARGGELRMLRQFHGLPEGDVFELVVDAATGILVEIVASWNGQETTWLALRDLRVDDRVETGVFDRATLGDPWEAEPVIRTARPLATLAAEVDFTLLAPPGEYWVGVVQPAAGGDGGTGEDGGPVVVAHLAGNPRHDRQVSFIQSRGAQMADPAAWEPITLSDGTPAWRWSPATDPEQVHLRFERDATQVWIRGRDADAIHTLAARLRPVAD